jgi:hypothetical protein
MGLKSTKNATSQAVNSGENQMQIKAKYTIDLDKLNTNVLDIRYIKNRHLTQIKQQMISPKY